MSNKKSWEESNNMLQKTFVFNSFKSAINFMQACIEPINTLNHHPVWTNVYNMLKVELQTHDAGNIVTQKDKDLAVLMDSIYENGYAW